MASFFKPFPYACERVGFHVVACTRDPGTYWILLWNSALSTCSLNVLFFSGMSWGPLSRYVMDTAHNDLVTLVFLYFRLWFDDVMGFILIWEKWVWHSLCTSWFLLNILFFSCNCCLPFSYRLLYVLYRATAYCRQSGVYGGWRAWPSRCWEVNDSKWTVWIWIKFSRFVISIASRILKTI